MSMGYRNPVDFGLNRHGEMFVYDADMEFDVASPWYRPTVSPMVFLVQKMAGVQQQKWRNFADTVGSPLLALVVRLVVFGTKAKFPTHYRDAMFL